MDPDLDRPFAGAFAFGAGFAADLAVLAGFAGFAADLAVLAGFVGFGAGFDGFAALLAALAGFAVFAALFAGVADFPAALAFDGFFLGADFDFFAEVPALEAGLEATPFFAVELDFADFFKLAFAAVPRLEDLAKDRAFLASAKASRRP